MRARLLALTAPAIVEQRGTMPVTAFGTDGYAELYVATLAGSVYRIEVK